MLHSPTTNRAEDVMKVRIGDRIYEVPDSCPLDAPTTRVLKNHLKTHGIESLLTSQKLSPFAGCVDGILDQEGVEQVIASALGDVNRTPKITCMINHVTC